MRDVVDKPTTWRECAELPVHPCAAVFPMLEGVELRELTKSIKENGLRQPIVLFDDGEQLLLLDGRNRLKAAERAGVQFNADSDIKIVSDVDPAKYVISANIHRRHLTKQQKALFILEALEARKQTDTATVAVSVKRNEKGQLQGREKDPLMAEAVEEGKKGDISERTMELADAKRKGRKPAPRKSKKIGVSSTPPVGDERPLRPPTTGRKEETSVDTDVPIAVTDLIAPAFGPSVSVDAAAVVLTKVLRQLETDGYPLAMIVLALEDALNAYRARSLDVVH